MSTISKQLSGFIFNGATLTLASAPWKAKVRAVYGFNAGGNGYRVFKPNSTFNSLTQLNQDGVYIVDASTTGFDLPGAVLTGAGGPATSNMVLGFNSFAFSSPAPGVVRTAFNLAGPAGSSSTVEVSDYSTGTRLFYDAYPTNQDHVVDMPGVAAGQHRYQVFLETRDGFGFDASTSNFSPEVFQVQ
jgi:hypothetical protein